MSRCRSCDAEIVWIKTKTGKNMPCDPDELHHDEMDQGDVFVTLDGHTQKVDKAKSYPNLKGYISHFATCPDAELWRNKQQEGGK
ncbi:MAG: hypothetical protein E6Q97_13240 [Desulfurellales bacterium]|nr:MAG: hypothetical protein E6Q97_13240 [Desulfurellales bacterium]